MDDCFVYNQIEYPSREIRLPKFGYVTVSITSLSNVLFNDNGSYPSIEAQYVDEQIFFFVEDDKIHLLNRALRKYILDAIL